MSKHELSLFLTVQLFAISSKICKYFATKSTELVLSLWLVCQNMKFLCNSNFELHNFFAIHYINIRYFSKIEKTLDFSYLWLLKLKYENFSILIFEFQDKCKTFDQNPSKLDLFYFLFGITCKINGFFLGLLPTGVTFSLPFSEMCVNFTTYC